MLDSKQIIDNIQKLPPLQRKSIEESYRNVEVAWKLKFNSAIEKDDNYKVSALGGYTYPWIYFNVEKNSYPKLKILHEDSDIFVRSKQSNVIISAGNGSHEVRQK